MLCTDRIYIQTQTEQPIVYKVVIMCGREDRGEAWKRGRSGVVERSGMKESGMEESGAWKKEASWKSGMEERRAEEES